MQPPHVSRNVRIRAETSNNGTDQRESTSWSQILITIAFVGVILATVFFLLRLYCRRKTNWKLAIEDLVLGFGLVFSYGLSTCIIIAAYNGVGHQMWALPADVQGRVALVFWLGRMFWALAHGFIKLSIILLINHLFGTVNHRRWCAIVSAFILFSLSWTTTALLGNIFQCVPPKYFWIRSRDGYCRSSDQQRAFSFTIGSLALAEDVALLAIPIVIVGRLHLARAKKIRVIVLFSFGGLVCIISILRLIELIHFQTDNLTGSGAMECIWATLEINLGIICTSLVLMRPLVHECRIRLRKCAGRNKEEFELPALSENISETLPNA
ncbi:hypothetical protein BJX66DRAFT_340471 [Aspergillus keveii]|uniref:Rhodopsin domain-containing protein n=1 Tax=Aspergillus keveii TaxID=714993 RepID=A0ABR4FY51_9EURO